MTTVPEVWVHDHAVGLPVPVTAKAWTALCENPAGHSPAPLRTVRHHVWPLGWGGPDTAENRAVCCDSCHYGTHAALEVMRRAGRVLSHAETRAALGLPDGWPLSRWVYATARRGWEAWEAGGRPPQRIVLPG